MKRGALLPRSCPFIEAAGPPPGNVNGFAPAWTRRQRATTCAPKPSTSLPSIPEESASQLDPAAPTYSPPPHVQKMREETGRPVTPVLGKMTGRWPESSSDNSFGSLKARDGRQGKKTFYSSRTCKSPQGTDSRKQLSALRREMQGMRISLDAAQERNDALHDSVTRMSRDVSDLVGLIRFGMQDSLAAVHGKMDVLQHNVSVVSETHLPAVIAAVSPPPEEVVQVKSP